MIWTCSASSASDRRDVPRGCRLRGHREFGDDGCGKCGIGNSGITRKRLASFGVSGAGSPAGPLSAVLDKSRAEELSAGEGRRSKLATSNSADVRRVYCWRTVLELLFGACTERHSLGAQGLLWILLSTSAALATAQSVDEMIGDTVTGMHTTLLCIQAIARVCPQPRHTIHPQSTRRSFRQGRG
ncbi:hypothetical protein K461DRAFT_308668 [Myriangium duriaei CBS 260.36]|uniref:Uncharacterized protein n=1 Tax=Myriangium duriaei CBS 260.36 TaxID=1168546 RepID=A0A9P4IVM8_9PEZI|nr:hypothetical protein K461DRAFT_308668 [Myriangium duriaei CBS 260.36]